MGAEADSTPVAEEHLHWGPGGDSIEHVMSAFCPCGPELVVEQTEPDFEGDDTFPVITYQHRRVSEQP
ncbi:hypothetical protein [Mycolicibacterium palauense]|uniref:hypothetical protein n=1 Tax=Mycolicibacterium palauense TaxID=2034511 RepID=UPI000BFF0F16|nr:hypothetical protein [Mycolicibacterium palauense]